MQSGFSPQGEIAKQLAQEAPSVGETKETTGTGEVLEARGTTTPSSDLTGWRLYTPLPLLIAVGDADRVPDFCAELANTLHHDVEHLCVDFRRPIIDCAVDGRLYYDMLSPIPVAMCERVARFADWTKLLFGVPEQHWTEFVRLVCQSALVNGFNKKICKVHPHLLFYSGSDWDSLRTYRVPCKGVPVLSLAAASDDHGIFISQTSKSVQISARGSLRAATLTSLLFADRKEVSVDSVGRLAATVDEFVKGELYVQYLTTGIHPEGGVLW